MPSIRDLFSGIRNTFTRGEQQAPQDDDVAPRESLYKMVRENKLDELKAAFDQDADLSTTNMLHNARSPDMVDFLVEKGANVNGRYNYGPNCEYPDDSPRPLEFAAADANVETVQRLIHHGANLDEEVVREDSPILSAVKRKDHDQQEAVVNALLDAGASVENEPVVPVAVRSNAPISVIEALLKHGASPDNQDYEKETGLHVAANLGRRDVAELLLDYGATPDVTNRADETPLHYAAGRGQTDVVQCLITRSGDPRLVNAVDDFNNTPLTNAAVNGNIETACALLESGADPRLAMNGDSWAYSQRNLSDKPWAYSQRNLSDKPGRNEAMNLVRAQKEKQTLRQTFAEVEQEQSPEVAEQPAPRRRARL